MGIFLTIAQACLSKHRIIIPAVRLQAGSEALM